MKRKYIEEDFRKYFIFGEHEDGCVDVSDGNGDIAIHVFKKEVDRLISDRDKVVDALIYAINANGDQDYGVLQTIRREILGLEDCMSEKDAKHYMRCNIVASERARNFNDLSPRMESGMYYMGRAIKGKRCPQCGGDGQVPTAYALLLGWMGYSGMKEECPKCKGTGRVPK